MHNSKLSYLNSVEKAFLTQTLKNRSNKTKNKTKNNFAKPNRGQARGTPYGAPHIRYPCNFFYNILHLAKFPYAKIDSWKA